MAKGWRDEALEILKGSPLGRYVEYGPIATEATALTTLTLALAGEVEPARIGAEWLSNQQAKAGSLGVLDGHEWPKWPTSLAILAWEQCGRADVGNYAGQLAQAVQWTKSLHGKAVDDTDNVLGHDSQLIGWPWVEGTHSWIEPTALHVMALKAIGESGDARTREAVHLLRDRLFKTGGCNYGNTSVFDQTLRPQVQPTGLALMALAGESDIDGRIARSVEYLEAAAAATKSTASRCWALLGLAAHDVYPLAAEDSLATGFKQLKRRTSAPYNYALLLLADPDAPFAGDLIDLLYCDHAAHQQNV